MAAQLLDPKSLKPGLGELTAEMVKRYKAETKAARSPAAHVDGLQPDLDLPRPTCCRAPSRSTVASIPKPCSKAALETDIPVGGTIQGYGVKFFPPGHEMPGQNERASPVVMQYIKGETKIVWPKEVKTVDPILPLPNGHAFAR